MSDPATSHQHGCETVARWMLKQPWCDLALCEMNGRNLVFPETRPTYGTAEWMAWAKRQDTWRKTPESGGGVLDVLGIQTPRQQRHGDKPGPRICIAEVKVHRSDLRRDLKKGKMLRYEAQATHVYLAGTRDVFGLPSRAVDVAERDAAFDELYTLGLPTHWGLVLLRWSEPFMFSGPQLDAICFRPARKYLHGREVTIELLASLTNQAAISLAHKALR